MRSSDDLSLLECFVYSYSFLVLLLFVLGGCSFLDLPSALEVLSDPEVQGGLRDVATNALSGNVVGALWALGGVVGCVATSKARKALKSKKLKPSESV